MLYAQLGHTSILNDVRNARIYHDGLRGMGARPKRALSDDLAITLYSLTHTRL